MQGAHRLVERLAQGDFEVWPISSAERGLYTVAGGGSADAFLTAMTAAENGSGMLPEQVWDGSAPAGDTLGTPTKSMNPLNWAMAQYVALLFSAAPGTVVDRPSLTESRYVTGAYQPHTGYAVDYNGAQLAQGKALTIYSHGALDGSGRVYLHWGENGWQNIAATDKPMVKRADGFWQTTISVPVDATSLNFCFNDGTSWDNNGGGNWNASIGAGATYPALNTPVTTFAYLAVQGQAVTITYNGSLASGASSLTLHWGYNGWTSPTDVGMTKQGDGSWKATVYAPASASSINTAYYNQSGTWDNNGGSNYNLNASQR